MMSAADTTDAAALRMSAVIGGSHVSKRRQEGCRSKVLRAEGKNT
jgi:hypothetical protein